MNIDLTPFLQALVGLIGALITVYLIPWIKARTTTQQQEALTSAVRIAVYAAEQLYSAGEGEEKMAYVAEYLKSHGWRVDNTAIEAAVKEMKIEEAWYQELPDAPDNPA